MCGVDALLGRVIGCVAEVGHVRPRSSHATVVYLASRSQAFSPMPRPTGKENLYGDEWAIGGPASVPRRGL